jgi:hypothetical protein
MYTERHEMSARSRVLSASRMAWILACGVLSIGGEILLEGVHSVGGERPVVEPCDQFLFVDEGAPRDFAGLMTDRPVPDDLEDL